MLPFKACSGERGQKGLARATQHGNGGHYLLVDRRKKQINTSSQVNLSKIVHIVRNPRQIPSCDWIIESLPEATIHGNSDISPPF